MVSLTDLQKAHLIPPLVEENGTLPATVAATTSTLDAAIRTSERNDAMKMMDQLNADDGVGTSAIRASYIAICHPDLRVDLDASLALFQ